MDELIRAQIQQLAPLLAEVAAAIHACPETGYKEERACALLAGHLERAGFAVERGAAGIATAIRAEHGGATAAGGGPTVGYLAEYDALPEIGHACGHNLIAAASLGAALALAAALAAPGAPKGRVVFYGTPAEEGGGGKIRMLEAGAFRDLDIALMFHPYHRNELEYFALGSYPLRITFRGKASHAAAAPHEGINALEALLLTFNGINALRQHVRDGTRIHGIVREGGVAPNIVPAQAVGEFYVRSDDPVYLEELVEKVQNCARGGALATGAEVEFALTGPVYAPMKNNQALLASFKRFMPDLAEDVPPTPSSSDLGNLSQVVPAIQPLLAISEARVPPHSPAFARAAASERGRKVGLQAANALALTGLKFLADESLRERVTAEFQGKNSG